MDGIRGRGEYALSSAFLRAVQLLCWWVQTEMMDWTLLELRMSGSVFNCFVDFVFHLFFLFQFSPYGKAWVYMFDLNCAKQLEVGDKKREIENCATGFSRGICGVCGVCLSKLGAECRELGLMAALSLV